MNEPAYRDWLDALRARDATPDLSAPVLAAVDRAPRRLSRLAWGAALLALGARAAATLAWLWAF